MDWKDQGIIYGEVWPSRIFTPSPFPTHILLLLPYKRYIYYIYIYSSLAPPLLKLTFDTAYTLVCNNIIQASY